MKKLVQLSLILVFAFFALHAYSQVSIDVSKKKYSSWEEAMKNPESVTHLDLSLQQLKELPKEIALFKNLEVLDLSFNHLTDLPAELKELKKLKILDLSGCRRMRQLPAVVKEMNWLEEIRIIDIPEWSDAKKAALAKELAPVKVVY